MSVKGYRTTWGAEPYGDQLFESTATVVNKLEEAGAVLVAKLSMGNLHPVIYGSAGGREIRGTRNRG
ncbi:MAG: hypothetical protein R2727_06495 [Bacteroidales bacterium]